MLYMLSYANYWPFTEHFHQSRKLTSSILCLIRFYKMLISLKHFSNLSVASVIFRDLAASNSIFWFEKTELLMHPQCVLMFRSLYFDLILKHCNTDAVEKFWFQPFFFFSCLLQPWKMQPATPESSRTLDACVLDPLTDQGNHLIIVKW